MVQQSNFERASISTKMALKMVYMLDKDGEIVTKDHLQKLFNIDLLDFDYYRVKSLVQKFKKKVKFEKSIYFHRA